MRVQDGRLVVKVGKRERQLTPKRLFLELEDVMQAVQEAKAWLARWGK